MSEEEPTGFEAHIGITLDGGNTRVRKEEIQAIFEAAKEKAESMNIKAKLEGFVR